MNTKKKIIYTLRSADKASVERLMAEAAKKDEIFAKVMERAEKDNEYTDVAEGAEKYNRRISIVHTASAAAASVLLVAGVWGAVHLLKSNKGLIDHHVGDNNMTIDMTDNVNNATAKNTTQNTKTTVFNVTSANENVTIVTATATADGTAKGTGGKTTETTTTTTTADNENTEVTTNAEAQQPEQKETGEQLREKCISAVYNYDKFSANYNFSTTMNDSALFLKFAGTIKIDNSSMTGELDRTWYTTNGNVYRNDYQYYLNDKFAFAADYNNGVLDANIKDMSRELPEGSIFDRVYFKEYQGLSTFTEDKLNGTRWEITGERNENGRNTTTVKIYYEDESSTVIIADIDTETGICIKYDKYENGEITESFTTSDRKFGEGAEIPKTEHEVKEIFESTYEPGMKEIYSDYKISDLN